MRSCLELDNIRLHVYTYSRMHDAHKPIAALAPVAQNGWRNEPRPPSHSIARIGRDLHATFWTRPLQLPQPPRMGAAHCCKLLQAATRLDCYSPESSSGLALSLSPLRPSGIFLSRSKKPS